MTEHNGEERRTDDTSVRLALLERSYFENKDSQAAIQKGISEFKIEVKADMRAGFDDLKEMMKESSKGRVVCKKDTEEKIQKVDDKVRVLQNWRNWLTGAYGATMIIVGAWLSYLHKGKP